MTDKRLLKYLGSIGKKLPELEESEWKDIFEFLEFFLTTEDIVKNTDHQTSFNWRMIKDILMLLGKMK